MMMQVSAEESAVRSETSDLFGLQEAGDLSISGGRDRG